MIIKDDSPLKRIPAALRRDQVLFLNGIRYAISMADYAYARLYVAVRRITETFPSLQQGQPFPNADAEINCAMIDAWSIIDSVHRLRELLAGMPNLKQNIVGLKLFRKGTSDCVVLRNAFQHLRHEITTLIKKDLPVWGTITWMSLETPQADIFRYFMMYGGTIYHQFVGPASRLPNEIMIACPVDHITLNAHGISVSLTGCHETIQKLASFLEERFLEAYEKQFGKDAPTNAADLIVALELMKGPPDSSNSS